MSYRWLLFSISMVFLPLFSQASICDRHPAIVQNLVELVGKSCEEIQDDDLARVKYLTIPKSENLFLILKKSDLAGLKNLRQFTISETGALGFQVEPGALDEMTQLKILEMEQCKLTELDENLFRNLQELEILNLRSNNFKDLKSVTFKGLRKLKYLSMNDLSLSHFDTQLFEDLVELKVLGLTINSAASIPVDFFANLKALEDLSLMLRGEPELPLNLGLVQLPKLKNLTVNLAQGFKLSKALIDQVPNLESLYFYNDLGAMTLQQDAFVNSPKLKTIILLYCNIKFLPDHLFGGLDDLQYLGLNGNQIETVSDEVFGNGNFSEKAIADLQDNPLSQETRKKLVETLGARVKLSAENF